MNFLGNLVNPISWNDTLVECANFGRQFVDDQKCYENSIRIKDSHTIVKRLHGVDIPSWMQSKFNYKIQHLQVFGINPKSVGFIHKDGIDRQCAFNIPIENCNLGFMQWFSPDDFTEFYFENSYTTIRVTDEEISQGKDTEVIPLFSTLIETPSLVNTNMWHRVDNRNNPSYRWMLSIRFQDNPTFLEMRDELIIS